VWTPWKEVAEQTAKDDFGRLWATNFLDDLEIETQDYVFSNGVIGKIVLYNMEERERVKNVTYEGTKNIDRTKITEQLKRRGSSCGSIRSSTRTRSIRVEPCCAR
jgi:outer membrane protein assembly factor BamA